MSKAYSEVISAASTTKTALIEEWKKEQRFRDKNKMTDEGAMPDAVGLTSLLLLLIAFREEPDVIGESDIDEISKIIKVSVDRISNFISNDGFNAEPIISSSLTDSIFKDSVGYTDTVTWVLSSSILARYAERTNSAVFDQSTHESVFRLLSDSLKTLLKAQRSDGTWGFMTETNAQRSLYYTYAAGSSVADFFDYILGEIEAVEIINDSDIAGDFRDSELISYLNEHSGFSDIESELLKTRSKLQNWLISDCLPLLPDVADCKKLSDENCARLGIRSHKNNNRDDDDYDYAKYYNLYYTYFLIDLVIMSDTDTRYKKLIGSEGYDAISKYYAENKLLLDFELAYFFPEKSDDGYDDLESHEYDFFFNSIERALHSSRSHFLAASQTGASFWDITDSELPLYWAHDTSASVKNIIKKAQGNAGALTEPSIVPMALRANTVYCYYISKQPDVVINYLFNTILTDRCEKSEKNKNCVPELWDDLGYNLLITERSVEGIVDFYDYVRKYDFRAPSEVSEDTAAIAAPAQPDAAQTSSALDSAVEKKIAEYLSSPEGIKLIQKALPAQSTQESRSAFSFKDADFDQLSELLSAPLERIQARLNTTVDISRDGDAKTRFLYTLAETFRELEACALRRSVAKALEKEGDSMNKGEFNDLVKKTSQQLTKRFSDLLPCLIADIDLTRYDLKTLYDKLKTVSSSK